MYRFLSILAVAAMVGQAGTTFIDFEGLGLANFDPLPSTYKSRDVETPNIEIVWKSEPTDIGQTNPVPYWGFWDNGYGDLVNAGYPYVDFPTQQTSPSPYLDSVKSVGTISFIADPGWEVRLLGFILAGFWPNENLHPGGINLDLELKVDGKSVYTYSTTFPIGEVPASYDIFYNTTLQGRRIDLILGPDWDVGIDNIEIQQIHIPEPSTVSLCALAGLAVLLRHRRASRG